MFGVQQIIVSGKGWRVRLCAGGQHFIVKECRGVAGLHNNSGNRIWMKRGKLWDYL